jgi:hypothetical protein
MRVGGACCCYGWGGDGVLDVLDDDKRVCACVGVWVCGVRKIPGLEETSDTPTSPPSSSICCLPLPLPLRVLVRSGSKSTTDNDGLLPIPVSFTTLRPCPCSSDGGGEEGQGDRCTRLDRGEVCEEGGNGIVIGTRYEGRRGGCRCRGGCARY